MAFKSLIQRTIPSIALYISVLCIYWLTTSGTIMGDGYYRYLAAVGIIERGSPALPPEFALNNIMAVMGKDGLPYAYYGSGQSLLFIPFHLIGTYLKNFTRFNAIGDWFISTLNCFLGAALVVSIWHFAKRLGYSPRTALATAVLLAVATPIWAESAGAGDYLLETTLLILCLFSLTFAHRLSWVIAGILYGYAIATRLSALFATPGLALLLIYNTDTKQIRLQQLVQSFKRFFYFGLGTIPGFLLFVGYNFIRSGQPFTFGYESKPPYWLGRSILVGLNEFLFSPTQGLVWYVPLIIALLFYSHYFYQKHKLLMVSIVIISLTYLLVYSQFSGLGLGNLQYINLLFPLICIVYTEIFERWQQLSLGERLLLLTLISLSTVIGFLKFSLYNGWMIQQIYNNHWQIALPLIITGVAAFVVHLKTAPLTSPNPNA